MCSTRCAVPGLKRWSSRPGACTWLEAAHHVRITSRLQASVERHTFWFKGAEGDAMSKYGNQQSSERSFMRDIATKLCANPNQSDDDYVSILHSMLDEVCH